MSNLGKSERKWVRKGEKVARVSLRISNAGAEKKTL